MIEHLLSPMTHPQIFLGEILQHFHGSQHNLLTESRTKKMFLTISLSDLMITVLSPRVYNNHLEMLIGNGFENLSVAPNPPTFPRALTTIITNAIPKNFLSSQNLIPLIQSLDRNSNLHSHRFALSYFRYELTQLQLYRCLEYLISHSSTYTPDQRLALFKSGQISCPEEVLLPPLNFIRTSNFSGYDFHKVSVYLIGSRLLRNFGTHLTSNFYIMNLSASQMSLHPTRINKVHGNLQYTGSITTTETCAIPVLSCNSFFQHVTSVATALTHKAPIIVEMDVSGLLLLIHNSRPRASLEKDCANYVRAFFAHFRALLDALPADKIFRNNYVVLGQMPFCLGHLSATENITLHRNIDLMASNIAAIFKVIYSPCYGSVGITLEQVSTIVPEPGPVFKANSLYSGKTQRQTLTLIEKLSETLTRLSTQLPQ